MRPNTISIFILDSMDFYFSKQSKVDEWLVFKNLVNNITEFIEMNRNKEGWKYHGWLYFTMALVPSEIACLASSPGKISLTADWVYREERVLLLLNLTSLDP